MTEYYCTRAASARSILQDRMGDSFLTWVWYIQAEDSVHVSFNKPVYRRKKDGKKYLHINVVFSKNYTLDEFMNTDVASFVDQAMLDCIFGVSQ